MKLSLNWLNEFVDLTDISAKEIASRLSLATAEVEGFEQKGHDISGVVVGEIITSKPHPNSKKPLNILTVHNGEAIVPVVCGCPNSSRVGMKVAFAKVGAKLPNGFVVGKALLAGEDSHGMCLGADELGLAGFQTSLIELDKKIPNGTSINVAIPNLHDTIFEIDNKSLTNRPDLWGHYGIARELATIFGRKLKPLPIDNLDKYKDLPAVPVSIESEFCYSFGAFRVDNITLKTTPLSMSARLYYCGINSHGFLVDLSNYILLELGQPNHAFDARKIRKLSAGHVKRGQFKTLKDQTIDIKESYTFIKSDGVPVSLAGIMGGANSLVCDDTNSVVFEFATFDAGNIRKTSTELGIRSDSSTRYEKSLDTNLNKIGAGRAIKLLSQFDKKAKVVSNFNWKVSKPTTSTTITLSKSQLEKYVGITFNYGEVKKNLKSLGFNPTITKTDIIVQVPTWRATKDITMAVDIIEEIVRIHGYDKIKPTPPLVEIKPITPCPNKVREDFIKDFLSQKYALNEVHTYIWNDQKVLKDLKIKTPSHLKILNSVASGCDEIRSEILPSLIGVVAKNKNLDSVRVFEIGQVYEKCRCKINTGTTEVKHMGIALASKTKSGEELYKELSYMMTDLLDTFGLKTNYSLSKADDMPFLHPKNNANILIGESYIGKIGIVHPTTVATIDSKIAAVASYVCIDKLNHMVQNLPQKTSQKISRFPKTTLDFTITTSSVYGKLESVLDEFSHPLSFGYKLKDIYHRDDNTISYTITFTIGSADKTLTSEEIQTIWGQIVNHLKKQNFPISE